MHKNDRLFLLNHILEYIEEYLFAWCIEGSERFIHDETVTLARWHEAQCDNEQLVVECFKEIDEVHVSIELSW